MSSICGLQCQHFLTHLPEVTHPWQSGAVHVVFFCVGWIFSLGCVTVASPQTMRDSQRSCTSFYVNGGRLPKGPHSCPLTGVVYPPCMEGVSLPWTSSSLYHTLLPRTFLPRTWVVHRSRGSFPICELAFLLGFTIRGSSRASPDSVACVSLATWLTCPMAEPPGYS